ncbi:hypothetical protein C4J98_1101 [Pseudomonas orientalis]|nr:hypothetical protein C4J98_1101 [Pseudomonas orientalis]
MAAPSRRPDGLQGVNARGGPAKYSNLRRSKCGRGLAPDSGVSAN